MNAERDHICVLRVAIEPSGDTLPHFHEFVLALVTRRLRRSTAQRIATAATELLDNAMAYATMACDIELEIVMDTLNVEITVSNDTVPSRIRFLEERVEQLQEDPEQAYMDEMRRLTSTQSNARPMMGLARVRHEARMDLFLSVRGNRVTVIASGSR